MGFGPMKQAQQQPQPAMLEPQGNKMTIKIGLFGDHHATPAPVAEALAIFILIAAYSFLYEKSILKMGIKTGM